MMDSTYEAGLELSSTLIKSEDAEESIERKNGHGMSREEELILFNIKEDEEGGERQSVEGKRENGVKDEAGDEMEQTSKTARGLEKRASNCKTPEEEVSSFLVTSCLLKRPRVPSPGSPVTSSNKGTAACEEDTGRRQRRQQSRMGDTDDTRTRVSDTPDVTSPRRKKPKRLQKYRIEWEKENVWVEKVHDNVYKAYCTVCWRAFSVGHGGLFDLKQHASSGGHIRNMRDKDSKTRGTLDQFVVHQTTPEADMVTAAEIAHIYHTVKHGLSYNSADCALKLTLQTLNDSNIAKKMSCGRTKAEAVVTHVLSPKAIEEVIKYLKSGGNPLPFSLHTDASNKGNRKMFPLAVQFFTPENGVVKKVIDFFENPDESAEGIVKTIQSSLENMGLSLDHVSAFSADNANVSYGIHNSVFTKLREANSEILRGNCHAHIVHNTVKKALDKLSVDVENIVLKIYSFFSTSARRSESLKEFCEFCDVEFHEILLHVATRWLSLNPAITRLLQNWVPLKSYLLSIGEECPGRLKTLLRLTEDAAGVEEEADIVEVYLVFCNHIMSLIEEVVKKLEKNVTTSVDLYSIMDSFLRRLIQRRDDGFYGYLTRQKLKRLSPSDADLARQEFTAFLNTAISYVQKWFDFSEENWLFHLQPLSLASGKISFDDMEKITERLRLVGRLNISMDELYDECVTANSLLEHLTALPQEKGKWQSKGTAERWMLVLQAAHLPNIQALVSFVLSIPSSTGFVERISSFMKNRWTDVRNKCSLELIRSELIVTLNYEMPCSEFYSVALKDKQLLAAARGQKKYKWKK